MCRCPRFCSHLHIKYELSTVSAVPVETLLRMGFTLPVGEKEWNWVKNWFRSLPQTCMLEGMKVCVCVCLNVKTEMNSRLIDVMVLIGLLTRSSLLRYIWHTISCTYLKFYTFWHINAYLWNHHYSQHVEFIGHPTTFILIPPSHSTLSLCLSQSLICFLSLQMGLHFIEMYIIWII